MKRSNNKLVSLVIGIVGLAWAIGVYAFARAQVWHLSYGRTLAYGIFAIVVAIVYLLYFRYSPGRQAEEIGAISIVVTVIYVIVALVKNTIMMLPGKSVVDLYMMITEKGGGNSYQLIFNIIITACYVILILYIERDVRRIAARLARTELKITTPISISSKLGALLGVTEDKEIHRRLLKLKEAVDYGSNITTANTAVQEQQMVELLDELMELIMTSKSEEVILSKLQQIEQCWKLRSSAAASIK